MKAVNWTKPNRAHLIINERGTYLTIKVFGRRFHFSSMEAGLTNRGLWQ